MKKLLFFYSIGLFALMPGVAGAATFFVNSATGSDANSCLTAGTPCATIEAALVLADATVEDDIINVAAGTYNTSSTDTIVDIISNVSIVGANTATTIIDGGGSDRGVRVSNATASISNVTIQNGNDSGSGAEGAGVRNNGILTLDTVVVQNNVTDEGDGGIFNGRDPFVDPPAQLTIVNSTISNNVANGRGGGISNGGRGEGSGDTSVGILTMVNSTISENTSGINPAGDSAGGGIYNHTNSTATLFNVTIADNTAMDTTGTLTGGGGVYNNGGVLTINNTLIGDNLDSSPIDANDCFGTLNSTKGYNLVEDTTGCTVGGSTIGNVTGIDPNIGPLANNGGSTFTHALLSGSEAIDAGDPSGCVDNTGANQTADQRDSTRPLAGISGNTPICDIGAYEAAAGTTPAPSPGGGGCSLAGVAQPSFSLTLFTFALLGSYGVWRRKSK
jgi:hypothetical protein